MAGVGIEQYFELVISGDSLAKRKPDPLPLQHVMTCFDCSPNQSLMVGDSFNDIYAARAAKVPIVCVDYGYNYGEPIPIPKQGDCDSPDILLSNLSNYFKS